MSGSTIERRHHRRVELPVQVSFQLRGAENTPKIAGSAKNVGLAGAYLTVPAPFSLAAGTPIMYSVEVAQEHQRQFPFSRLLGTGWVVRVDPQSGGGEVGVALAFSGSSTILSTVQP